MLENLHTKTIIGLLFITLFFACDPGVQHSKIIQNDSDYDLFILSFPSKNSGYSHKSKVDSFIVLHHSSKDIYNYSGLGQTFEFEDCATFLDSFSVKVIGSDQLKLHANLNVPSNWEFNILRKSFNKGGNCECRIKINNQHIY